MQDSNKYLSLQSGHNLLPRFHNRIKFSSHHDGEALVLGKRELDMCPGLLHDIQAHFRLLPLAKLTVVFIPALLQRNMEHLKVQREVENVWQALNNTEKIQCSLLRLYKLQWMIICYLSDDRSFDGSDLAPGTCRLTCLLTWSGLVW